MHILQDIGFGIRTHTGTMMFFQSFTLGFMIEDAVQELCRQISGTTRATESDELVPVWKKVAGFIWTLSFICIVAPWYGYPVALVPMETRWTVPYEFTEKIGAPVLGMGIGFGALILRFVFKAEM
jgi:hypothetical protein